MSIPDSWDMERDPNQNLQHKRKLASSKPLWGKGTKNPDNTENTNYSGHRRRALRCNYGNQLRLRPSLKSRRRVLLRRAHRAVKALEKVCKVLHLLAISAVQQLTKTDATTSTKSDPPTNYKTDTLSIAHELRTVTPVLYSKTKQETSIEEKESDWLNP